MTQKFDIGTRVSINSGALKGRTGTVRGALRGRTDSLLVEIDGEFEGHNGNGLLASGDIKINSRGWYIGDHALVAIDRVPGFQFSAKNPPKVGDVVKLVYDRNEYTVSGIEPYGSLMKVLCEERPGYWCIHPTDEASGCTLVRPAGNASEAPTPAKQKKPRNPTAPMTAAVLDLLKSKGSVTSMEANGVIKCRSLSKRISELKALGWNIKSEIKRDHSDQRYARYHLIAA